MKRGSLVENYMRLWQLLVDCIELGASLIYPRRQMNVLTGTACLLMS